MIHNLNLSFGYFCSIFTQIINYKEKKEKKKTPKLEYVELFLLLLFLLFFFLYCK